MGLSFVGVHAWAWGNFMKAMGNFKLVWGSFLLFWARLLKLVLGGSSKYFKTPFCSL
jgi:hypothetical protein